MEAWGEVNVLQLPTKITLSLQLRYVTQEVAHIYRNWCFYESTGVSRERWVKSLVCDGMYTDTEAFLSPTFCVLSYIISVWNTEHIFLCPHIAFVGNPRHARTMYILRLPPYVELFEGGFPFWSTINSNQWNAPKQMKTVTWVTVVKISYWLGSSCSNIHRIC